MKYIFSIILFLNVSFAVAQTDKQKEKAEKLGLEAIRLMDEEGDYKKAVKLLFKAIKIHPDRFDYPYEIAYALYQSKLYDQTIDWLKPLETHPDVSDALYQLLGNSYDEIGLPDSAIFYYLKGLEKFPNSGRLYLEPGIVEYRRKNYDAAIEYWENGIRVQPNFSSNYFWLGRTLSDSNIKIWSLIYGELFMLLEPATERSQEMSSILYDVYNSAIQFTSDTSATVSLNKEMVVSPESLKKEKLPFELTYELMMTLACIPNPERTNKNLSIYSFAEIRESFIKNWILKEFKSNILFDFYTDMLNNNVFTSYNYWLIMMGDAENYSEWFDSHQTEFEQFADYFNNHRPELTKDSYLIR